ncbi:uroporphyrinogen-III C-methyltransferase [Halalkalibacter sp. AB-rgal2]|uniref:uroporphyrinogen-III C-methyltransferase n=1 Tax=Halalkalibacter sp. AB-rgal2 TaxID=3242695 RepID=UPI00359E3090
MQQRGIVYFVGAGPGDPELLTIKGRRVLREADVIIFDRLVNPILLMETKSDAKLVYCGKQPCQHLLRQEDIHKELLIHARKGKTVVRLKGGDPSVFGRVGEEAESLSKHGISFEIIPGITAGIAVPAYAGATITHREHSRSFAVVSGHSKSRDGQPRVDWGALASGVDTIVFYMGIKHVTTIVEQLQAHGMKRKTPVLIIQWGTYSRQRTIEGTLATIVQEVSKAKVMNPAIIMVGDVVTLRKKLQWFENRPLSGISIFIPKEDRCDDSQTLQKWRRLGADIYSKPLSIKKRLTVSQMDRILELSEAEKLTFLSSSSVVAFIQSLHDREIDRRRILAEFYCMDDQTKEELKKAGFIATKVHRLSELNSPIVVGSKLELTSLGGFRGDGQFIQIDEMVTVREKQMMQRMIEEQHVNTLILTNKSHAINFLNLLKEIQKTPSLLAATCTIICEEQVGETLQSMGIVPAYMYKEKLGSDELLFAQAKVALPEVQIES